MKKTIIIIVAIFNNLLLITAMYSCQVSHKVISKSGVQLWAENCQRCHNTPSSASFSPEQWETIGMHMQTRSLITNEERNKIVEFLKQ